MKTYRISSSFVVSWIILDLLLCCVFIGFLLLPCHLLKYYSMSLTLGEKGLILKTGILSTRLVEIKYEKINSITVQQGLLGNMLGYGNLIIFAGNDVSGIAVKDIDNPHRVKSEIDYLIHNN